MPKRSLRTLVPLVIAGVSGLIATAVAVRRFVPCRRLVLDPPDRRLDDDHMDDLATSEGMADAPEQTN